MYVYIVEVIHPYDGSMIEEVYANEKAAQQHVKALNKDLNPKDSIDSYAMYRRYDLMDVFTGLD